MKPIYILVMAMIISIFSGCTAQSTEINRAIKEEANKSPTAEVEQSKSLRTDNVIKIGVSMQGLEAPYVAAVQEYLESAVEAAGIEAVFLDAQSNAEKQISQIEQFIAWKVDVIILNPISYTGCAPAVVAANKANIPVITLITLVENQDQCAAYVGSDHKESGVIEAEMVVNALKGKGKAVIIEGVIGIESQIKRTQGYEEVLKNNSDIEVIANQSANWQRSEAYAITENWIKSGKKFDVVLSQNDNMALGALRAVEQANLASKIKVFGIDGDKDALEAVKSGRLAGTVFQDAKGQAEQAIDCAIKLTKGEPIKKYYFIPFQAVTQQNAGEFLMQ